MKYYRWGEDIGTNLPLTMRPAKLDTPEPRSDWVTHLYKSWSWLVTSLRWKDAANRLWLMFLVRATGISSPFLLWIRKQNEKGERWGDEEAVGGLTALLKVSWQRWTSLTHAHTHTHLLTAPLCLTDSRFEGHDYNRAIMKSAAIKLLIMLAARMYGPGSFSVCGRLRVQLTLYYWTPLSWGWHIRYDVSSLWSLSITSY